MAIEVFADETPEVEAAKSPADNEVPEVKPDDASGSESPVESEKDEPQSISLEKHREELKQKNSEAHSLRNRLKTTEGTVKELQEVNDALTSELETLRGKVQAQTLATSVTEAARDPKVGAKYPEKLVKLIDRDNLTFEDDGSVKGIAKELARLKAEWPDLFHNPNGQSDAGASGTTPDKFDMNAILRRQAGLTS